MKIQQDFSDYVLNNPSYTGLRYCGVLPGVSCRSTNVKLPDTIDLETSLLRGKPSDLETLASLVRKPTKASQINQEQPADSFSVLGSEDLSSKPTRMSKSCYFEQSIDRFDPGLTGAQMAPLLFTPERRIGTSSRDQAKYKN